MTDIKAISPLQAARIFLGFTVYFYLLLFFLFPLLAGNFMWNSAVYWFITGSFLFIPMFVFAVYAVKKDGKETGEALALKRLSKSDWRYAVWGLLGTFILTGVIFGISLLLHQYAGIRMLQSTPWFMEVKPFQGWEKLWLLLWFPMFFFNIAGEEILWRGYIQNRMDGKYSWVICSLLWAIFHLPFGVDMIIMAAPALVIIPFLFSKTRNTSVGIFIHAMYNGPIFILIALGVFR